MRTTVVVLTAVTVLAAAGCTASEPPSGAPTPTPAGSSAPANGPPADLPPIGPVADVERAFEAYFACMTDRGWQVTRTGGEVWNGGAHISVPEEQEEVFEIDDQACMRESGRSALGAPTVSAEDAAALYDLLLPVADCVRRLGYPVTDPPSKQSFVDNLVAYPIPSWHPYSEAVKLGKLADVEKNCPVPDWP